MGNQSTPINVVAHYPLNAVGLPHEKGGTMNIVFAGSTHKARNAI